MLIFERVEIFNHIHKKPCFSYVILKNTALCTASTFLLPLLRPCAVYLRSICGSNESICLVCFFLLCPFKAHIRAYVYYPIPCYKKISISGNASTPFTSSRIPHIKQNKVAVYLPFICRLFAVYFYNKQQVFTLKHKT